MKLIVGLGNPDHKYNDTRHNIGFAILDFILTNEFSAAGFTPWQESRKFEAFISEGKAGREKIILAKPTTYMNNSGISVKSLMAFYKIKPADLVVVQDELDFPLGKFKVQKDRSSAGHKGVQSIIDEIGTQDFTRVRIGIGQEDKMRGASYVLSKFTTEEKDVLQKIAVQIMEEVKKII